MNCLVVKRGKKNSKKQNFFLTLYIRKAGRKLTSSGGEDTSWDSGGQQLSRWQLTLMQKLSQGDWPRVRRRADSWRDDGAVTTSWTGDNSMQECVSYPSWRKQLDHPGGQTSLKEMSLQRCKPSLPTMCHPHGPSMVAPGEIRAGCACPHGHRVLSLAHIQIYWSLNEDQTQSAGATSVCYTSFIS